MFTRDHYICAPCRNANKDGGPCRYCGSPMTCMGKKFHTPRRNNKVQWKKLDLALQVLREKKHHPNCFYANQSRWKIDREMWAYYGCKCPTFRDFKTPADVKSGRGLRRSDRRNYAEQNYRGRRPL